MSPIICGAVGDCENCGHLLWQHSNGKLEHWTRHYKPSGYPYATDDCYAPSCKCKSPKQKTVVAERTGLRYTQIEIPDCRNNPEKIELTCMGCPDCERCFGRRQTC